MLMIMNSLLITALLVAGVGLITSLVIFLKLIFNKKKLIPEPKIRLFQTETNIYGVANGLSSIVETVRSIEKTTP